MLRCSLSCVLFAWQVLSIFVFISQHRRKYIITIWLTYYISYTEIILLSIIWQRKEGNKNCRMLVISGKIATWLKHSGAFVVQFLERNKILKFCWAPWIGATGEHWLMHEAEAIRYCLEMIVALQQCWLLPFQMLAIAEWWFTHRSSDSLCRHKLTVFRVSRTLQNDPHGTLASFKMQSIPQYSQCWWDKASLLVCSNWSWN